MYSAEGGGVDGEMVMAPLTSCVKVRVEEVPSGR
jgi:hypothetical protein